MQGPKLSYYSPEKALKVNANFFGKTLEKNAPGPFFCLNAYRYGFNGQEKDDEIAGSGNSYTAEFWQYDSRLGRRWNLDPKPNPSISQYATFALNPIRFSDPEGDTIQVSFRAGGFLGLRKNQLNFSDGKLYNRNDGSEYTGKMSNFANQVVSDLGQLSLGGDASNAMDELIASSNVFNIVKRNSKGSEFVPNSRVQSSLGNNPVAIEAGVPINGSGGTVYYNTQETLGGINTRGLRDRPGFVSLGHELLGHGLSANRGMTDYSLVPNSFGVNISRDEYFASDMENRIRASHGLPLRSHYGIGPDGKGFIPLLQNGKGTLSGHDYYNALKIPTIPASEIER